MTTVVPQYLEYDETVEYIPVTSTDYVTPMDDYAVLHFDNQSVDTDFIIIYSTGAPCLLYPLAAGEEIIWGPFPFPLYAPILVVTHTQTASVTWAAVTTIDIGAAPTVTTITCSLDDPAPWDTSTFTSDAAGDTLSYVWLFGDGGSSTDAEPTHYYELEGAYTVRITITDKYLRTATTTTPITVTERGTCTAKIVIWPLTTTGTTTWPSEETAGSAAYPAVITTGTTTWPSEETANDVTWLESSAKTVTWPDTTEETVIWTCGIDDYDGV